MRNWKTLTKDEMRQTWDWRPCPDEAFVTEVDTDLAYIPGYGEEARQMLLVTGYMEYPNGIDSHWGAELNVILDDGHDNVDSADGETMEEACMWVCLSAACCDFFDRLFDMERNCEDAVNKLAYESWALWANEDPLGADVDDDIDWFLGKAREYVKDKGPLHGLEWEEF